MKEEKLSEVTLKILDRSEKLKWIILGEMIPGDSAMVLGVIACENIVRMVNPEEMNEGTFNAILGKIKRYFIEKEEKTQRISKYEHAGVDRFCMMLEGFLKENNIKKLNKKL